MKSVIFFIALSTMSFVFFSPDFNPPAFCDTEIIGEDRTNSDIISAGFSSGDASLAEQSTFEIPSDMEKDRANEVQILSLGLGEWGETQTYCEPVVTADTRTGPIKMVKIVLDTLQRVYVIIKLDGSPISNYSLNVDSSPYFHNPFPNLSSSTLNQINGGGTLGIEVLDSSSNLLASTEITYQTKSCKTSVSLSIGPAAPFESCIGNSPYLGTTLTSDDGENYYHSYIVNENLEYMSTNLPQGTFDLVLYTPIMLMYNWNQPGIHLLRADAYLEQEDAYISNTVFFSFKSCTSPSVTTNPSISSITSTSAQSGGTVVSEGGDTVTVRGVCWNTSGDPTTSDSHTVDGSGKGEFTSSITGLNPGITYHVRAYASNSAETGYGDNIPFTTSYASTLYVISDGQCGQDPCYQTIQLALEAAEDGSLIKVADGTYSETPNWKKTGMVTISGGWKESFTVHDGMSEIYNALATGGGAVKLEPNVKVLPQ